MNDQPIIALSTPQGSGALALIRISGSGTVELVDKISKLSSKKKLIDAPTHTIHHGTIINPSSSETIDEVLFFLMRSPRTFTGEDTVEISCHNNPFIVNKIIEQAVMHGAHHAQKGEFTKRAVLNQKIDLLQAEAINDLITAQNETALKKSMSQLRGTLSHHTEKIEAELIALLGNVEASFEFLDEEQRDIGLDNSIRSKLDKLIKRTDFIISDFSQQQHIRRGIRIALVGSTNVGKSTLFNRLVKEQRAIVTNIPGTTRDAIETSCYKEGNFWLFVDTAGLRKTKDEIEQKGIDRSWQEAAQSDIILLVFDSTKRMSEKDAALYEKIQSLYPEKVIMTANKIDSLSNKVLAPQPFDCEKAIPLSAKTSDGVDSLEKEIKSRINQLFSSAQSPFLLNQRQYDIILGLNNKLKHLRKRNNGEIHYEIMAYHLKNLISLVSELTGKTINEQMMDSIFSSFCVGK